MLRDPEQRSIGRALRGALEDLSSRFPLVDVIVVVVEISGDPHRLIGEYDVRDECSGLVRVG
jgi:hypothetical protein